jgi:hypothetical protein
MSKTSSSIFVTAIKLLLANVFKILIIAFAWLSKLIGIVLTQIGETIEKIIVKRSH